MFRELRMFYPHVCVHIPPKTQAFQIHKGPLFAFVLFSSDNSSHNYIDFNQLQRYLFFYTQNNNSQIFLNYKHLANYNTIIVAKYFYYNNFWLK